MQFKTPSQDKILIEQTGSEKKWLMIIGSWGFYCMRDKREEMTWKCKYLWCLESLFFSLSVLSIHVVCMIIVFVPSPCGDFA